MRNFYSNPAFEAKRIIDQELREQREACEREKRAEYRMRRINNLLARGQTRLHQVSSL